MKLTILMFTLLILINNDFFHSDKNLVSALPFNNWRFEILNKHMSQLKKKIQELKKSFEENSKNKDEEMRREIVEKFLLPRVNGTTLLKDFYAGRY
jgi:hypothetical protein